MLQKKQFLILGLIILAVVLFVTTARMRDPIKNITPEITTSMVITDSENAGPDKPELSADGGISTLSPSLEHTASSPGNFVQVNVTAELEEFEIPLSDADIELGADIVTLITSEVDMTLQLNGTMELKDFNGLMKWKDSIFFLKGGLYEYLSSYVKMNWKKQSPLTLRIDAGNAAVGDVSVDMLKSVASGSVESSSLKVSLNKDEIYISKYKGDVMVDVDGDRSTIRLIGRAANITIVSDDFTAEVK